MKKYAKKRFINALVTLMLSVTMVIPMLSSSYRRAFVLGYEAPEPEFGNYYTPDYASKEEAFQAGDDLTEEICEEGFTLLKNEDNALPLGEGARISVFGKSSTEMLYGLSSNYVHLRGSMVTLQQSLQSAGFQLNPTLINFYNSDTESGQGRGAQPTNGAGVFGYNTGETPLSMYTPTVEESYTNDYNDAAVVVFSRSSGEGWDNPRTMEWNGSSFTSGGRGQLVPGARSMSDHYLQLDQNESDLLKYLGGKFNKVVVLLNTPTQFETGFLDDSGHYGYHENIKAALWLGYPGKTGIMALGRILNGEVNPSGKTVDTWARDFKQDPTWQNLSDNRESAGNRYSNLSGGNRSNYVIYKEGIYIGYRYYETRGFTEGLDNQYIATGIPNPKINGTDTTVWNDWYTANIVYPFGHGLSYTTFSQELVGAPANGTVITENSDISLTVMVTNTGARAGKETVQIFYTAPYFGGEIEKAHVVLGGFTKTKLLEPGESQNVTVVFKAQDMASYDFSDANFNGFKGYELEAGDYEVKLMTDAHNVIDTVTYTVANDIECTTDSTTGNTVENQFDDVSNYLTDTAENGGLNEKYMSRANFAGTFPTMSLKIAASSKLIPQIGVWTDSKPADTADKPYYVAPENMPNPYGNDSGDVLLSNLIGADYNDPLWDEFLDQVSYETMKRIVGDGGYRSGQDIPALGIPRVINAGQPAGYMSLFSGMEGAFYAFYPSDVVLASSHNEELAYRKGVAIGNEALFGTGNGKSRFPGWYAPAVNTHRSPFGGRNADYYSEDGVIGGKMAAQVIQGAMEKGVFCFLKHFAVNDQEANRVGLLTWANEQSMREIYFKPFEICVKEGKTVAIMSALNRLGPTWVGGHYGLLTNVLRKEWGFVGAVVTDSYIGSFSSTDQMIRAGGDLALGYAINANEFNLDTEGATFRTYLRNSTHNVLYVMANSMAMNTGYATPPDVISDYTGSLLPVAAVGLEYSANLGTAKINPGAFEGIPIPSDSEIKYALKEGSLLPAGLTLSDSGVLSGTPLEEVNSFKFIVQASYNTSFSEATFIISIADINGSIVYQMDEDVDAATIGKAYSFSAGDAKIYKPGETPEEIANYPPITYTLKNASKLPEGLTLNQDGTITGTPTKECIDYSFTVTASAIGFKDKDNTFTISVFFDLSFSGKTLSEGKIGVQYFDKIAAAVSDKTVTYALKDPNSLPKGLNFTNGGFIAGTPTEAVTDCVFIVIATAEFCAPQEAEYKITIGLAFNKTELPDGKAGQEYYTSVDTVQGASNVTYALKEGSVLPEGLELSDNGEITGTPAKAGVYTLTLTANAEGQMGDEVTVTLYIANADKSVNSDKGCGSAINLSSGGGLFVLMAVLGAGFLFSRKKKYIS